MPTPVLAPAPRFVAPQLLHYLCLAGCLPLFGWFFASFGSLFGWFFLSGIDWRGWDRYQGTWEEARGRVTAVVNTGVSINDAPVIHRFDFTFRVDGRDYVGRSFDDGNPGIAEGEERLVRMLPGTPASARLEGTRHAKSPMGLGVLFVLIFPLIGLGLVTANVVGGRRMAELLRNGALAQGRIVAQNYDRDSENNSAHYDINVLYHNAADHPQMARFRVSALPAADTSIYVLYDPTRPKASCLFAFDNNTNPFSVSPAGEIVARKKCSNPLIYVPPLVFLALQVLFCYIFVFHLR